MTESAANQDFSWFCVVGVRSHGDGTVARVELPPNDIDHAAALRTVAEQALRHVPPGSYQATGSE